MFKIQAAATSKAKAQPYTRDDSTAMIASGLCFR